MRLFRLISKIIGLLQDGKFNEALPSAMDAVRLEPNRYEGQLYLGIIRFRQDALTDANELLQKALGLAPEDRKAKVRETLEFVTKARQFNDAIAAADQALKQGLNGRAARAYTDAWKLGVDRDDVGLKAATLWLQIGTLCRLQRFCTRSRKMLKTQGSKRKSMRHSHRPDESS
jgi:tetratricopeptide (TPR) repeat protein